MVQQVAAEGIESFNPEEPSTIGVDFQSLSFAIHSGTRTNPYRDRLAAFLCSQIRPSHVPQLPPGLLQLIGSFVLDSVQAVCTSQECGCNRVVAQM